MLYPQSNAHRQSIELSGFWNFRFDQHNTGLENVWQNGFTGGRPIAVPSSWNDQFEDGRDYLGTAWYQTILNFLGVGTENGSSCVLARSTILLKCG
jgi:beta-glucuronidase